MKIWGSSTSIRNRFAFGMGAMLLPLILLLLVPATAAAREPLADQSAMKASIERLLNDQHEIVSQRDAQIELLRHVAEAGPVAELVARAQSTGASRVALLVVGDLGAVLVGLIHACSPITPA